MRRRDDAELELLTVNEKVVDSPNVKFEGLLLSVEQTKNIKNIRNEEISDDVQAPHLIEILCLDFDRLQYALAVKISGP